MHPVWCMWSYYENRESGMKALYSSLCSCYVCCLFLSLSFSLSSHNTPHDVLGSDRSRSRLYCRLLLRLWGGKTFSSLLPFDSRFCCRPTNTRSLLLLLLLHLPSSSSPPRFAGSISESFLSVSHLVWIRKSPEKRERELCFKILCRQERECVWNPRRDERRWREERVRCTPHVITWSRALLSLSLSVFLFLSLSVFHSLRPALADSSSLSLVSFLSLSLHTHSVCLFPSSLLPHHLKLIFLSSM